MKAKKAIKLKNEILTKNNCTEVGIFISLLSSEYITLYDIPQKDFLKSLKNSLKIIEEKIGEKSEA